MTTAIHRCDYCGRRYTDKRGCEYVDEDERPPVYGSECHPLSLGEKCYDCGCPRKTLHHATCLAFECVRCHRQGHFGLSCAEDAELTTGGAAA